MGSTMVGKYHGTTTVDMTEGQNDFKLPRVPDWVMLNSI